MDSSIGSPFRRLRGRYWQLIRMSIAGQIQRVKHSSPLRGKRSKPFSGWFYSWELSPRETWGQIWDLPKERSFWFFEMNVSVTGIWAPFFYQLVVVLLLTCGFVCSSVPVKLQFAVILHRYRYCWIIDPLTFTLWNQHFAINKYYDIL